MRSLLRIFTVVLLGLLGAGCNPFADYGPPQESSINFDIVVKLETSKGLVEGVSKIEVDKAFYKGREEEFCTWVYCLSDRTEYHYNGRATAIRLPNGDEVFVLLSGKTIQNLLQEYTNQVERRSGSFGGGHSVAITERITRRSGQFKQHDMGEGYTGIFRKDSLPYFVRFRDSEDFQTIEMLDPYDLEQYFPDKPSLISIGISMENAKASEGLLSQPWLKDLPDTPQGNDFPNNLTRGSFYQGRMIPTEEEEKAFQDDVMARIKAKCAAPEDPHLIAACARQKEAQNWKQF